MLTQLASKYADTELRNAARQILQKCVHRGFCNATCPTFIEVGDQNDGPRGRMYLIKALLEGESLTKEARQHLDLCLACRSCETTCPASIEYGKLINIAKTLIEQEYPRPFREKVVRWSIRQVLPYRNRFAVALTAGQFLRPLLPAEIKAKIPTRKKKRSFSAGTHDRFVIMLAGCTQPAATPNTNIAARIVMSRLGISAIEVPRAGCCGSIDMSLGKQEKAKTLMKKNIDAWWPEIENGAEAILSLSSSCELMLSEYGYHLRNDPEYAEKAQRVSKLVRNIGEILLEEDLTPIRNTLISSLKVALHSPCSLRHGLDKHELPEMVLQKLGIQLAETTDNHICCGSGGTYSLLQTKMSQKLLNNKIKALTLDTPNILATSNASCQLHLQSKVSTPVKHWIELLDFVD